MNNEPLPNAHIYRHEPEEKYLEPLDEKDPEIETAGFRAIEAFASSADELLSVKIYGQHHSVKKIMGGFYIVTSPQTSDYADTIIFQSPKRGIIFAPENIVERLKLHQIHQAHEAAKERFLRARRNTVEA